MAGGRTLTMNAIVVPLKTDVAGFTKGLDKARKSAHSFDHDVSGRLSKTGSGISGFATKARAAIEGLGKSKLAGLAGGLEGVSGSVGAIGGRLAAVGAGAGAVAAGVIAVGVAAAAAAAAVTAIGFHNFKQMGKDAQEIGVSAEALSRLRGVARATGTDFGDLSKFIEGLNESIHEGIGRTTVATQAFAALGTSAEALAKMSPEDQIKALNRGFAALPDDAERARVAMQLAGQNGVKVFRMLAAGTKEFDEAFNAAPIISEDDVSEARKLQIAIDKIGASVESLANLFASKLLPAITSAAEALAGIAGFLGVKIKAAAVNVPQVPKIPASLLPAPLASATPPAVQAARNAQAEEARRKAAQLQARYDKQAADLRRNPGRRVYKPSTNGMRLRPSMTNQKAIDQHAVTGQELNAANRDAKRLSDAAKTQTQAMNDAVRANIRILGQIAELRQDYRQSIEEAGKDEIHRRVDQIKGLTPEQRKTLLAEGYQAREANRTSALRDELQESTKLPVEKLGEDLARISRMVALGPANGGLNKMQGLRAAAMKTQEAGIAGNGVQFAGALEARSMEGRSYLLSQTVGRPESVAETARKGLEAAQMGNGFLARIAGAVERQTRPEATVTY